VTAVLFDVDGTPDRAQHAVLVLLDAAAATELLRHFPGGAYRGLREAFSMITKLCCWRDDHRGVRC
jgi:hypothetical protein